MLDHDSIQIYKERHLPRDLRADILIRHDAKRTQLPRLAMRTAAAMASLAVVVGISLAVNTRVGDGVYLDGRKLNTHPRAVVTETVEFSAITVRTIAMSPDSATSSLQTADGCIPLRLQYGRDVYIVVSGGVLLLPASDGVLTVAGQSGMAADGQTAYWLPEGSDQRHALSAQLYDLDETPIATLTLSYDTENALWRISVSKEASPQ